MSVYLLASVGEVVWLADAASAIVRTYLLARTGEVVVLAEFAAPGVRTYLLARTTLSVTEADTVFATVRTVLGDSVIAVVVVRDAAFAIVKMVLGAKVGEVVTVRDTAPLAMICGTLVPSVILPATVAVRAFWIDRTYFDDSTTLSVVLAEDAAPTVRTCLEASVMFPVVEALIAFATTIVVPNTTGEAVEADEAGFMDKVVLGASVMLSAAEADDAA